MAIKTPDEVKLWRAQQKLDGTQAMADYKSAEGTARDRLTRLRTERKTREAASEPRKAALVKATLFRLLRAHARFASSVGFAHRAANTGGIMDPAISS